MKYIRIFICAIMLFPFAARAADSDFLAAAQLLSAAKNADIAQVQALVNDGANVNYVDSTGLSLVCTALMNNDLRAAQILQMYGADASKCDQQIKKFNSRTKESSSGGLFGGLSTAQTLALTAAGAAVVVGGLFLLTDVFDAGNGNGDSGGGGDRPGSGGDGTGTGAVTAWSQGVLPYGPLLPNAESETANYATNLNYYSPSEPTGDATNILYDNFVKMNSGGQNYLLMMHGYSPLARGYLGQRTLRTTGNIAVLSTTLADINIKGEAVTGGMPAAVGLITANGINAAAKPVGELSAGVNSLDDKLLFWTTVSGDVVNTNPELTLNTSSKYYNNKIVYGASGEELSGSYTVEDAAALGYFDLAGFGTVVNNAFATDADNMLAKVVAGTDGGYSNGDYMGFMPNGQIGIFRTGGGMGFLNATESLAGTYTDITDGAVTTDSTITIGGVSYTIETVSGNSFVAKNGDNSYAGYILNNVLYFDSNNDGGVDQMFAITAGEDGAGTLELTKTLQEIDYKNYDALLVGGALWLAGDGYAAGGNGGARSRMNVLANASVISPLHSRDAATIESILSNATESNFVSLVNGAYNRNETDGTDGTDSKPGTSAQAFFSQLGSLYSPLVVFSTGASENVAGYTGVAQTATFENAAPLVYGSNLEHLFMSVVAVGLQGEGTSNAQNVAGFTPSGKYALAQWQVGTGDDATYYKARKCGIAGRGADGIDPWCFAASGLTDELAVASAAGAAGALQSAFAYMSNRQIFTLMALTADGAYLGTNTDGTAMAQSELISYLQSLYSMPGEDEYRWQSGGANYLDVFKDVFGYGLINLERATKPGTSIYYYDGTNIVSASGNAYWRAASNTTFRASAAFSPRAATISAPFYDMLRSIDGELSMPRIWQNEFELKAADARGLYMGDVLGELKTRDAAPTRTQMGNLGFAMSVSARPYTDAFGGLDTLQLDWNSGALRMAASYQRYLTDGMSRFDGTANPIMSMASNAVTSDVAYGMGRWSLGARAFSGAITDESLLETDPTISSQFQPARLGLMQGAQSHVDWAGDVFGLTAAFGAAHETDTLLGARTGGLLNLGAGDTTYIDVAARVKPVDMVNLTARATFARTNGDATGAFIMGMDRIDSDAFSLDAKIGGFEFAVARPLGVRRGAMRYAYADYDVVDTDDGNFDLVVRDTHVAELDLRPEHRELRFSGTYRRALGEWTDGAIGFIYRVNPNHTDEFGNESIFMMKLTHRLGI